MTAVNDLWTRALDSWKGMTPPLMNPANMDPWQAVRVGMGVQRAALDSWRDSCKQAHELCSSSMGMGRSTLEQMAEAGREARR